MAEAVAAIAQATAAITIATLAYSVWEGSIKEMIPYVAAGGTIYGSMMVLLPLSTVLAFGVGLGLGVFVYTMAQPVWGDGAEQALQVQGTMRAASVLIFGGVAAGLAQSLDIGMPGMVVMGAAGVFLGMGAGWNAFSNLAIDMGVAKPVCKKGVQYPGHAQGDPCVTQCTYDWGGHNFKKAVQSCGGKNKQWCIARAKWANTCPDDARGLDPGPEPPSLSMQNPGNSQQCSIYAPYTVNRIAKGTFADMCAPFANSLLSKNGPAWGTNTFLPNYPDNGYGAKDGTTGLCTIGYHNSTWGTGASSYIQVPSPINVGAYQGQAQLGWQYNPATNLCAASYMDSNNSIHHYDGIDQQPTVLKRGAYKPSRVKDMEAKLLGDYNVAHTAWNSTLRNRYSWAVSPTHTYDSRTGKNFPSPPV